MKPTRTSKAWMQEHLNDEFVKRAQKEGYRARAAYKLIEIDDNDKLIKVHGEDTIEAISGEIASIIDSKKNSKLANA